MAWLFRKTDPSMWLIVGLGNPGEAYEGNRHNIGFMVADALAVAYDFPPCKSKFQGKLAEGRIGDHKIVLLKPQTYMNESGLSVGRTAHFYKIPADHIVVLHDELDLPAGKIRVKIGGGHAGHNGLRSIDNHLNTKEYHRIRLGIGHPGDKGRVHDYVLGNFSKNERQWLDVLKESVSGHIGLFLDGKNCDFMSKVAMETTPPSQLKE